MVPKDAGQQGIGISPHIYMACSWVRESKRDSRVPREIELRIAVTEFVVASSYLRLLEREIHRDTPKSEEVGPRCGPAEVCVRHQIQPRCRPRRQDPIHRRFKCRRFIDQELRLGQARKMLIRQGSPTLLEIVRS